MHHEKSTSVTWKNSSTNPQAPKDGPETKSPRPLLFEPLPAFCPIRMREAPPILTDARQQLDSRSAGIQSMGPALASGNRGNLDDRELAAHLCGPRWATCAIS